MRTPSAWWSAATASITGAATSPANTVSEQWKGMPASEPLESEGGEKQNEEQQLDKEGLRTAP